MIVAKGKDSDERESEGRNEFDSRGMNIVEIVMIRMTTTTTMTMK